MILVEFDSKKHLFRNVLTIYYPLRTIFLLINHCAFLFLRYDNCKIDSLMKNTVIVCWLALVFTGCMAQKKVTTQTN